jgi:hypothetical protein
MKIRNSRLRNLALLSFLQVSSITQEHIGSELRHLADFPESFITGLNGAPSKVEPVSLVHKRPSHASGAGPSGTYPVDSLVVQKAAGFRLTFPECVLEHFGTTKLDYSKLEIYSSGSGLPGGISIGDTQAKVVQVLGKPISNSPDSLSFIAQSKTGRAVAIDFVFKSARLVSITWCLQ